MDADNLYAAMRGGLSQSERLLKLDTPLGSDVLLPQRMVGESKLGRNYDFTLDAVSLRDTIALKTLIAQPVTLWLQQTDKSYLPLNGYVHTARRLGSDSGLTTYQLAFSSWLHFLHFRKDARIWQDRKADEIITDVFNQHPQAKGFFKFDLINELPPRSFCTQYEDDWCFVHRIMEEEGLFGYFQQAADGKSHTYIITDDLHSLSPVSPQSVQFYRSGTNSETDAFVHWSGMRTLQSASLAIRTFDYKNPQVGKDTSTPTVGNQGDLPSQTEVYEYTGPYTYLKQDRGDHLSKVRLEEWESRAKRFTGIGSVRRLDVGRWFELQDHPDHTDGGQQNQFAVIGLRWYVENNLPVSGNKHFPHSLQAALAAVRAQHDGDASFLSADAGSEGFFLSEAEAQRRTVPFRSPFEHRKPRMDAQTATVVGPSNSEVFTDAAGRIKVHMHWDRLNSGDENASCWLRVVYPNAGDDHGGVFIPRIGQEVVITFLGGDCDRPVVSGRVYNSAVKPQWHSHGLLSGYKSKEFGGTGFNQLVLDDATGQNRTQLYSSSAESYLHLGYLIDQRGNTRGNFLGTGFDLKSNAYGAVRAGQGLYVSTYSRGGAASQPLDVKESQQHLVESEGVIEMRSEAAQSAQAEPLQDAHDALKDFSDATQSSVQGSSAGGSTADGGTGSANGFASPVMLLGSPAGIALSSQKSVHMAATEQINLVSGASINLAAKKSLVASVGEKISLFAQSAGVKLFAGKGKVELQAQADNLEITADKTLKVVSTSDSVNVSAQKEITLTAGGATIRIANGNIYIHAPGLVEVKGSNHTFSGPAGANDTAQLPPTQACSYKFASAAQSGAALVD